MGGCNAEASEGNQSKRDILCHPNGAHPCLQHGTILLHHSTRLLHCVHSGELLKALRCPAHTCMHCLGRCLSWSNAKCLDACCHCLGNEAFRYLQLGMECTHEWCPDRYTYSRVVCTLHQVQVYFSWRNPKVNLLRSRYLITRSSYGSSMYQTMA